MHHWPPWKGTRVGKGVWGRSLGAQPAPWRPPGGRDLLRVSHRCIGWVPSAARTGGATKPRPPLRGNLRWPRRPPHSRRGRGDGEGRGRGASGGDATGHLDVAPERRGRVPRRPLRAPAPWHAREPRGPDPPPRPLSPRGSEQRCCPGAGRADGHRRTGKARLPPAARLDSCLCPGSVQPSWLVGFAVRHQIISSPTQTESGKQRPESVRWSLWGASRLPSTATRLRTRCDMERNTCPPRGGKPRATVSPAARRWRLFPPGP